MGFYCMQLRIIDVSYAQPTIDYAKVKATGQVDGAIIRCGRTFWGAFEPGADKYFEKHYQGFKSVGIPVGAYYYGVAKNPEQAKQEAEECLRILKGKQFELPIYYDVEEVNTQGGLTREQLTAVVQTFCETLEAAGYFAGFYTMLNWAKNKMDYPSLAKKHTSWIAWIGNDPATALDPAPAAWQYSWKGQYDGIPVDVDQNYFYQDFPTIIKQAGLNGFTKGEPDHPKPPVPEVSKSITWDELKALLEAQGIKSIEL